MFFLTPNPEFPFSAKGRAGPLLELEARANAFLTENSGNAEANAVELVRLYRDEIRRQRTRELERQAA